jgi:murein DD-endopeptidase MepM/ murein hydrolase activator NlpD
MKNNRHGYNQKRNQGEGQQNTQNLGSILVFFFFGALWVATSMLAPYFAFADDTTISQQLQALIQEKQRNLDRLNQEIQQYQALTDKTSQEAKTLQGLISQLEKSIKGINLDIKSTSGKIDITNLDIKKLDLNINDAEERIRTMQDGIGASIREIQRAEDTNIVENILNQKTLTGFLSEIEQQLGFNDALQTQMSELRKQKQTLEVNKSEKEVKKDELLKLQHQLTDRKKAVQYTKSERDQALRDTKSQEKNYQKILNDKLALKTATEKDIFDYESKLKYTLDPNSIPKEGSSALSWPVEKVIITQYFGKTVAARRLYVSGSHNGVDFGARIGTPVLATADGVIDGTGDTDLTCKGASFGRWILIKHFNGLATTYGHLSVISVSPGQNVKRGDVVGYSGNTGYTTGPHVHISVYPANAVNVQSRPSVGCGGRTYTMPIAPVDAYLDPILYLPTYTK